MSREYLTPEEAEAMLPDGDEIHTFLDGTGMLLGADWSREQVVDLIRRPDAKPERGGPACTSMGHGLVAWDGGRPVFIQTRATAGEATA